MAYFIKLFVMLWVLTVGAALSAPVNAQSALSDSYTPGLYAVGVKMNFVKDFSRPFDAWGSQYKNAAYQELLAKINASGEPSTVATNIYYPSPSSGVRVKRQETLRPAALWAATSGQRQTTNDMFNGNTGLAKKMSGDLGLHSYQSYVDAPLSEGQFPLVVMIHGLTGGLRDWNRAAEYLASHGYIVVTLAYSSDSMSTPVFEDPNSFFAKTISDKERMAAYKLRASQTGATVFNNFFKFLYGYEADFKGFDDIPDPSTLKARKGGGIKSAKMMADLFEQRTEDLNAVIQEMKILSSPASFCKKTLERNGVQKDICGFFAGSVDFDHIGVMGHSLGAITAQSALAFLPDVDTAIAFNNGMPKRWEPYGGLPNASEGDLPDGVPEDFMIVIGSDDYFVHMVFQDIHLKWFEEAGGDINETFPLAIEQVRPTEDNPQPVARAAYERAQAAKVLVMFRDQGHGTATDSEFDPEKPGKTHRGKRVPLNRNAKKPETYTISPWVKDGDNDVFLPHQMRNYFITAWFDWQLKGNESAKAKLLNHPFENGVKQLLHEKIAN